MKQTQTGIGRSKVEMVDHETGKSNSDKTDSDRDEEDGKSWVAIDVARRNQTDTGHDESCNITHIASVTVRCIANLEKYNQIRPRLFELFLASLHFLWVFRMITQYDVFGLLFRRVIATR